MDMVAIMRDADEFPGTITKSTVLENMNPRYVKVIPRDYINGFFTGSPFSGDHDAVGKVLRAVEQGDIRPSNEPGSNFISWLVKVSTGDFIRVSAGDIIVVIGEKVFPLDQGLFKEMESFFIRCRYA